MATAHTLDATALLLGSALDCAARGWPVFPAPPGEKKSYIAGLKNGGPRWGATTDPAAIRDSRSRWPNANVGIACGPESGLFVVEADTLAGHDVDGVGKLKELIEQHGGLPDTIEAVSPSGSRHFYFAWPDHLDIRNSEGRIGAGIDVRGNGGMVIAPPSIKPGHPEPYCWIKPPGVFDLAPCPDWLLRLCAADNGQAKNGGAKNGHAYSSRDTSSDIDDRVLSWLYTRPNNLSRPDWVKLCLALKNHFGQRARDGWLSFSNRYGGETTDREAERQWETANPDGRADIGSAIRLLGGFEHNETSRRREHRTGTGSDNFDPETGEDGAEPFTRQPDEHARREAQRAANIEIGEGSDVVPTARIFSLTELCEQFVFIKDGSQVAPMDRPQAVLALADFRNAMAGSKYWFEVDGKPKSRPAVLAWLEDPARMEAEALTFRAGAERITTEPDSGRRALNLWVPIPRLLAPDNWLVRAQEFVDQVHWLWGADAGAFLDWLAHIEQRPGVLPHYGWVHISRVHGKGRNWLSSVLARLWPGHVAASLDLISILEGGFNGRMSRKLLAIVDEINEGGSSSYRHAQTLRQLVTAEHREINPKYGRQRVEWNACRWLMFSNHTGAIPLGEDDRRFWIVSHEGQPQSPDHYAGLYRLLGDPLFIASIAEFLRRRDVSGFKPGERPPMTTAKAELIAFSQSEDDATLKEIVDHWPVDIITNDELTNLLDDGGPSNPATRHAMDRAGIRKLERRVRLEEQGLQRTYAVRNFARWATAEHADMKKAIEGFKRKAKWASIGRDYAWND